MARARVSIGLIALAAMLGSHWVAYLFAAPDPHARADLLASTGHGYWPSAAGFAVAALVLGLGAFISQRLAPAVRATRRRVFTYALPRFFALQVGGFTALELVERLVSGHAVGVQDLVASTFLIGIAIQSVAAFLSAVVLVLVATVIEHLIGTKAPEPFGSSVELPLVSLISPPRPVPATGARTLRGPPLSA